MQYEEKYLKYKHKYLNLKKQNGGSNIIIHIAGTQGSGKTTLGERLVSKYGDKIFVYDLDNLRNEYISDKNKYDNYQDFLYKFINNHYSKPLILVGLDAEMCLGEMKDSDKYYDLKANIKLYIKSSNQTLKQRFFRQLDKLDKRKEWFFENWLKNPESIQEKIFRFVDLNKWKENNEKCDRLYGSRGYVSMTSNEIFEYIDKILDNKNL